jgi:hypothetical protein
MKERNQRFFLIGIILVILLTFAGLSYYFLAWIPNYSSQLFGNPSPSLDNSHRIILSLRLFLKRDLLLVPNLTSGEESLFIINSGESAEKIAEDLK